MRDGQEKYWFRDYAFSKYTIRLQPCSPAGVAVFALTFFGQMLGVFGMMDMIQVLPPRSAMLVFGAASMLFVYALAKKTDYNCPRRGK